MKQKKIDQLKVEIERNRVQEDEVQLEANLRKWRKTQKATTKLESQVLAELEMYKQNYGKAEQHLLEILRKDKEDVEAICCYAICVYKKKKEKKETLKLLNSINSSSLIKTSERASLLVLNALALKGMCIEESLGLKEECYKECWNLFQQIFLTFRIEKKEEEENILPNNKSNNNSNNNSSSSSEANLVKSVSSLRLKTKVHPNYFQFALVGLAKIPFLLTNQVGESVENWRRLLSLPFSHFSPSLRWEALSSLSLLLLHHLSHLNYSPPLPPPLLLPSPLSLSTSNSPPLKSSNLSKLFISFFLFISFNSFFQFILSFN